MQGTSRGIEASANLAILEKQAHYADTKCESGGLDPGGRPPAGSQTVTDAGTLPCEPAHEPGGAPLRSCCS